MISAAEFLKWATVFGLYPGGGGGGGISPAQLQHATFVSGDDTGSADAYEVALTPALTTYTGPMMLTFIPGTGNTNITGTPTVDFNGVGPILITGPNFAPLSAGDIVQGTPALILYNEDDGSAQLLNPQVSSGGGAFLPLAGGTMTGDIVFSSASLVSPTDINDGVGGTILGFIYNTSAVNHLSIYNAASVGDGGPGLIAEGPDSFIPLGLATKNYDVFVQDYTNTIAAGIRFFTGDALHYTALRADNAATNSLDLMLPQVDGSAGWLLSTDGAGRLSFVAPGGGGGVTSTQVQDDDFNYCEDLINTDDYVASLTPPAIALTDNLCVRLFVTNGNQTNNVTFNLDGLGGKDVRLADGSPIALEDVNNHQVSTLRYNSFLDIWILENPANTNVAAFYVTTGQYLFLEDTGVADAYVVDNAFYTTTSKYNGQQLNIRAINSNTGASTLTYNGDGGFPILKYAGDPLVAGDIINDHNVCLIWNGRLSFWQLLNPLTVPSSGGGPWVAGSGTDSAVGGDGTATAGGNYAVAYGNAVSPGQITAADGHNSFAMGTYCSTDSDYSFIFGESNTIVGSIGSFAMGTGVQMTGGGQTNFGFGDAIAIINSAGYAVAFGSGQTVTSDYGVAFGSGQGIGAEYGFAAGEGNTITDHHSTGIGRNNLVAGNYSFVYGNTCNNRSTDNYCFVFGNACETNTGASYSFVGGQINVADGTYNHIWGINCYTSGDYSQAFGNSCNTYGNFAYAGGSLSNANAAWSWARGNSASTTNTGSVVWGDSVANPNTDTASNQFNLTFANGYRFFNGATLAWSIDPSSNVINHNGTADQSYSLQAPTTGFTITIDDNVKTLALNPSGTLATGTITMPANPIDGQEVRVTSSQIVTTLTVLANAGQTISGAPTTITDTAGFAYIYNLSGTNWYRLY